MKNSNLQGIYWQSLCKTNIALKLNPNNQLQFFENKSKVFLKDFDDKKKVALDSLENIIKLEKLEYYEKLDNFKNFEEIKCSLCIEYFNALAMRAKSLFCFFSEKPANEAEILKNLENSEIIFTKITEKIQYLKNLSNHTTTETSLSCFSVTPQS